MSENDWTKHDGGQCPKEVIEAGRIGKCVLIKFRDMGTEPTYSPRLWRWVHAKKLDDIVGYRIIEPPQERRTPEEEKAFRDANYQEHLANYRKATEENGGVPIRLGIDTP